MADRLRKLKNDGGTAWNLSKIGLASTIAASEELVVTTLFTDTQLADFIQRGDLVLSADHKLVVESGESTREISDGAGFGQISSEVTFSEGATFPNNPSAGDIHYLTTEQTQYTFTEADGWIAS